MGKLKELYIRFFHEKTPEFHAWLRNRAMYLSGISGTILIAVDKFPNAFDPWVSKVAGYLIIGGIFGAGACQTAKCDKPLVTDGGSTDAA